MKRFSLCILILIVLVGLFSPLAQVHAETYGECRDRVIEDYNPETWELYFRDCEKLKTVCTDLNGISNFICNIHRIVNAVVPVLTVLGVVYIVWGIVQYVIGGGEETRKRGRDQIVYGIIGLSVIIGLWGLVTLITNTFDLSGDVAPALDSPITGPCSLEGRTKFKDLICYSTKIINNSVIPLIFSLSIAMFVWGVVQYVIKSDEEAKKEKGRQFMIWGIIAIAVMISVWGLVGILGDTFGIEYVIPQV